MLREDFWLAVFREAAREGRSLIFTFAPEATVSPDFAARLVETAAGQGCETIFVKLMCAASVQEQRLDTPSRVGFGKLRSLAQFRELRAQGAFDVPEFADSDLVIDTGALSAKDAAHMIRARFAL
jgi:hypothetical protein